MNRRETELFVKALKQLRDSATDAQASESVEVYPTLKESNSLVKMGTRINWNGVIKRAAVDLWDTKENNPDNAPSLWEDISYIQGYRIIPEVITVGTAFIKDECGWWNGTLYKSLIDANVYTPEAYPSGWVLVQ